ncbi:MAG: glutaredoxin domain-containing protein [Desulfobacterales bacterium]
MTKQFWKYLIFWCLFLMIFMVGVFAGYSIADMYKWVDENGVAHFSDAPPGNADNSDIETLPTYITPADNEYSQENISTENKENRSNSTDTAEKNSWIKKSKVELYTTSWCPWCKKAKAFFRSRGISFIEYDIEKNKAAARRKAQIDRQNGVPFAVINGIGIHGYNVNAYIDALK